MKTSSKQIDVYQIVTDLIIEKLESGIIPWHKPWSDYGPAMNYITRKPYRGINQLILNGLHLRPFYLTFQQAIDLGGSVKKGSKSIPVTYWNILYREASSHRNISVAEAQKLPHDQVERVAFLKYYRVFNIDDVQNVKFDIPKPEVSQSDFNMELCDEVIRNMPLRPEIRHERNEAYYHPIEDYINMPELGRFQSPERYFYVLFHEAVHCSGHFTRLNRFDQKQISAFSSEFYSVEELVAEIGAAFLSNHTGIMTEQSIDNSSAYIQGWLKPLKNDKKFIVEAAAKAQKAVDYILNQGS